MHPKCLKVRPIFFGEISYFRIELKCPKLPIFRETKVGNTDALRLATILQSTFFEMMNFFAAVKANSTFFMALDQCM